MNERQTDFEWLQQFARAGNQSAFRDLVRRHIDLVFATALRKVGDTGGAEEISQNVFTALAHKAWRFAPDDSVPAWLHKTALLESKSWLRGELRRRRREQTAAELGTTMKTPDEQTAFQDLVPMLDEAMLSLREQDRTALLLRFCESQSLKAVGQALGVSDDTAQKRVQSALEKLSGFFQRRGFKTATVAATAAALQHTAASASAMTVSVVINGALQAAPPALAGLTALLARFVSLTKLQTTAVCLVIAALPVTWQISERSQARTALAQTRIRLTGTEDELSVMQTEIQRLSESATKLEDSLARARNTAAHATEMQQRFDAWKPRVRDRLLAADYSWPDDLPFVRISKKLLPELRVYQSIRQPGTIKQEARELLGLTPAEREQAEAALQKYFTAMDSLMELNRYETNRTTLASIPADALASRVFGLTPLGDEVKQRGDELQAALKLVLGDERWMLVSEQLKSSGTDTLRRVLNLDAGERGQELAVWIKERNGTLVAGHSWGEQSSAFSQEGLALKLFLPGAQFPEGAGTVQDYLDIRQLASSLTGPAMEWIRQQAAIRLETKGDQ